VAAIHGGLRQAVADRELREVLASAESAATAAKVLTGLAPVAVVIADTDTAAAKSAQRRVAPSDDQEPGITSQSRRLRRGGSAIKTNA
jgi:hypothetical protein